MAMCGRSDAGWGCGLGVRSPASPSLPFPVVRWPPQTQLALCHYATSYEEENFPRAREFRPERWLREGGLGRVDNFGSIPFGYGVRSCIGRRIAELEIHLLMIQVGHVAVGWLSGARHQEF